MVTFVSNFFQLLYLNEKLYHCFLLKAYYLLIFSTEGLRTQDLGYRRTQYF